MHKLDGEEEGSINNTQKKEKDNLRELTTITREEEKNNKPMKEK